MFSNPDKWRGGFQLRGAHDFVRLPLCHDSTGFENHDFIAQCEHFFAIVRDQQNWNAGGADSSYADRRRATTL